VQVTIKFIALLAILLVGVALGLQTAERGIYKVEGLPEHKPQTFYIKKMDQGQMEIAVMGKQLQTEPGEVVNYVSRFGTSLGHLVKNSTREAIDWLAGFF